MLYVHYDGISRHYPGWSLSDLKGMSHRERTHWVALIKWRMNSYNDGPA